MLTIDALDYMNKCFNHLVICNRYGFENLELLTLGYKESKDSLLKVN